MSLSSTVIIYAFDSHGTKLMAKVEYCEHARR